MTVNNPRVFIVSIFVSFLMLMVDVVYAQQDEDVVVYSGYFSREQNDGEMAQITGKSHYVKFFADNRFIRLYIPYPFSKKVTSEQIMKVFKVVDEKYKTDAYVKDGFGILEEKIIAHIDSIRRVNDEIMFDCGFSAPCKIVFENDLFKVIKKGIVKDNVTLYYHVKEKE
ncbi:MAG: hypothetical protein OEZ38_08335 [Gammaproteobacteria bacterium]|nr:hypothetical protein [Gammaproteobacteria bacterium]